MIINGKYLVTQKISSGSFGVVFFGQDTSTDTLVAIKVEKQNKDYASLDMESKCLLKLSRVQQIPRLYWYGQNKENNVLVMQLLGKDLAYHLRSLRTFSLNTVLKIGYQLLKILERIHKSNIIHRDIKPENILLGRDKDSHLLYLCDFGISQFYMNSQGQHIQFAEKRPFVGTTRYASIAAHRGYELSRRDDLESLGYMLIYLYQGKLQWQSLNPTNNNKKIYNVGRIKQSLKLEELCKNLPVAFFQYQTHCYNIIILRYLEYVRQLGFEDKPDYQYLKKLLKKLAGQCHIQLQDKQFDWDVPIQNVMKIDQSLMRQKVKLQNGHLSPSISNLLSPKQLPQLNNSPQKRNSFHSQQQKYTQIVCGQERKGSFSGRKGSDSDGNSSIRVGIQSSIRSSSNSIKQPLSGSKKRDQSSENIRRSRNNSQFYSPQRVINESMEFEQVEESLLDVSNFTEINKTSLNQDDNDLNSKYRNLQTAQLKPRFKQRVDQDLGQ